MANPYHNSVGHSTVAPWMGEHTRVGKTLPKTEFRKAMKKNPDAETKHPLKKINEDIILDLLDSKKVHFMLILLVCQYTVTVDIVFRIPKVVGFILFFATICYMTYCVCVMCQDHSIFPLSFLFSFLALRLICTHPTTAPLLPVSHTHLICYPICNQASIYTPVVHSLLGLGSNTPPHQ